MTAAEGHLLGTCLQYGQVLATAASRLVSAAAITPGPPPHTHTPLPTPPTDVAAFMLFMAPACFDFKYLPRRRLFRSAGGGGVGWGWRRREKSRLDLKCTKFQILAIRTRTRARTGRGWGSVWPVVQLQVLMIPREKPREQLIC